MTQGTLTSMFHMRPLHEIAALQPLIDGTEDPYPLLRLTLNDNPAFDLLRSKGYRIVTSNPGYEHVALRAADVFFDNGALNEVERQLIRFTPIHRLVDAISPSALAGQHRERILANFTFFVDAARAEGPPTMAFIHIPSPHLPVVVDSNGEVLAEPPGDEEYAQVPFSNEARATYRGQIDFLEETVLESMDAVLSGRQGGMEPIIILMSDHGAAPPALVRAGIATDDHYENLFAVRMPDGADIYPADITLVNLFPILFNHLFDIDAPLWPNDRFPWQGFGGDVGQ
jgi:hypothetical protein